MLKEEKIVMYDSPESARKVEQVGWKSRLGHFYPGDNASSEHGARWSGCTHQKCKCGNVMRQGETRCDSCQSKIDCDRYYALPIADWDGETPTCDNDRDKYFWDKEQLLDEMYWQLEDATKRGEEPEMHVVICEPHYLHQLSYDDWVDDLADDGELPDAVNEAIEVFNEILNNQKPSCWYPGKQRINMESLWEELKADLEKDKETTE